MFPNILASRTGALFAFSCSLFLLMLTVPSLFAFLFSLCLSLTSQINSAGLSPSFSPESSGTPPEDDPMSDVEKQFTNTARVSSNSIAAPAERRTRRIREDNVRDVIEVQVSHSALHRSYSL